MSRNMYGDELGPHADERLAPANSKQVGGNHYKGQTVEHWDYCWARQFDFFQYQITKYVERWRKKGGVEDLKKARHFLDKYIEVVEALPPGFKTAEPKAVGSVPDFMQYVKPTGWIGFVFEGADGDGFLYTCPRCKAKVRADQYVSPWMIHDAEKCSTVQTPERQPWELRQLAEILAARSSPESYLESLPAAPQPEPDHPCSKP